MRQKEPNVWSVTEYFSELVLGLPGDTKERHFESLRVCVDELEMNLISSHQLMVLDGTPLAIPDVRDRFDLDIRSRIFAGCLGEYEICGEKTFIAETEEIVVGSKTMTFEDWIECRIMDLLVKIYIDRDSFLEIFGLIRRLGLSCMGLISQIRDGAENSKGFANFLARFVLCSSEPFLEGSDQVRLEKVKTRCMNGEPPTNELLVYRALAFLENKTMISIVLVESAKEYLFLHGLLDEEIEKYLDEAIYFSTLRRFDPADALEEKRGVFNYDFILAAQCYFEVLPEEIRTEKPVEIVFSYGASTQGLIEAELNWWKYNDKSISRSQWEFNMGKMFHITNTKALSRKWCFAEVKNDRAHYHRSRYLSSTVTPPRID